MQECSLCNVVQQPKNKSLLNKNIYEWGNFQLIPSIGPIDMGHFLIISKYHSSGLATMPKTDIASFFSFIGFIEGRLATDDVLFFEHGSYEDQSAGSCVDHTHIHVLPNYSDCVSLLDGVDGIEYSKLEPSELHEIDYPYIMTFNLAGDSRIYKAYNVHSQMMRKAICAKRQRTNWDWRADRNVSLVKEGIEFWVKTLNDSNIKK
ncbi:MAG: HIT domain-containing protein [Bacteroidetes bacterium]|nr:HIT domain-containing protein [Bacteroidota bacterium]